MKSPTICPQNSALPLGAVGYGPSTRRLIDFADPTHTLTINPVGQSGVPFDKHYKDQAQSYIEGRYDKPYMEDADVQPYPQHVAIDAQAIEVGNDYGVAWDHANA